MWCSRKRRNEILQHVNRVAKPHTDTSINNTLNEETKNAINMFDCININGNNVCIYCGYHQPDQSHLTECRSNYNKQTTILNTKPLTTTPIPVIEYVGIISLHTSEG